MGTFEATNIEQERPLSIEEKVRLFDKALAAESAVAVKEHVGKSTKAPAKKSVYARCKDALIGLLTIGVVI